MKKLLFAFVIIPLFSVAQENELYPIEDAGFLTYLQVNFPQTLVNDSLNINATTGITDVNVDTLEIFSLDGLQYFSDLTTLNCVSNNLSTLPELPAQIEYINCQWNQIETLPEFPQSLKNFDGRHNLISVVPELPNTMEVLRVCFNEVTTIPVLPDSLKILFCAYNYEQLTFLPNFPDHLEQVLCFDNEITQISEIPETMYKFMMQNNSISQIPSIPRSVTTLNLANNPIDCVNYYPKQVESQMEMYPHCNFIEEYTELVDSLDFYINAHAMLQDSNNEALQYVSDLQETIAGWNTSIDLQEGWNMFGYSCPESLAVSEVLFKYSSLISIVKDNNGNVYLPEFGFNGIGSLNKGFGYQIKLLEAIDGFGLCD